LNQKNPVIMLKDLTLFVCLAVPGAMATTSVQCQSRVFHGVPVTGSSPRAAEYEPERLGEGLAAWSVYALDVSGIHAEAAHRSGEVDLTLRLGNDHEWKLDLWKNNLVAPDYVCRVATEDGIIEMPPIEPFTYSGWLVDRPESRVRFSIREEGLVGSLHYGGEEYMIEAVSAFDRDAPHDLYVVYNVRDIIGPVGAMCGSHGVDGEVIDNGSGDRDIQACAMARIAIATDFSMLNWLGSIDAVQARLITLLNIVDGRYRDSRIEIAYQLVTTFISRASGADPWDPSTDAYALLESFRHWGNGGGFGAGVAYDLASFWTRRDIAFQGNSAYIGLSYVGFICDIGRYNLNEQNSTSTSTGQPSILQTHEIGHNWSAEHTATSNSTHIMSSSFGTGNTQWDNNAIAKITGHKSTRTCLSPTCPPVGTIGMDEITAGVGLVVSPNPSSGRFLIDWNASEGARPFRFEVVDALGRHVTEHGVAGRTSLSVEVSGGPGLYILRSLDRDGNLLGTHRLVKY